MPPPAELQNRPQDGISWVQKVATVELGFLAPYLIVWGYVGIYRRKKYVGGASWGPQGWRARPPALWAPRSSTDVLLPPIYTYVPPNDQIRSQNLIPPPQPSVPTRSHLGAYSGPPPERASIMEGFYINTIASPMKCE